MGCRFGEKGVTECCMVWFVGCLVYRVAFNGRMWSVYSGSEVQWGVGLVKMV